MAYPASAFTQQPFITHRTVIQHHQPPQQQQQQQQPQQPTHVAPAILSTPPVPQQQHPGQGQPTPPGVMQGHGPPLPQAQQQQSSASQPLLALPEAPSKTPYGAGGDDDGYTLVFANLDEFQAWREKEEAEQCVDFVKGDVHGSRAVPPRFREHTKLVCARHVRSGRKKYIKKHPERVRKLPSRKLEGIGCPASISYKTYHDVDTVRACYNNQHSHPVGPENYPFTRRGRKQMANERGQQSRKKKQTPGVNMNGQSSVGDDHGGASQDSDDDHDDTMDMGAGDDDERQVENLTSIAQQSLPPQPVVAPAPTYAQPPAFHHPYGQPQPPPVTQPQHAPPPQHTIPPPTYSTPAAPPPPRNPRSHQKAAQSSVSAAPPPTGTLAVPQQPQQARPTPPPPPPATQPPVMDAHPDKWRWDRLTAMFEAIKTNSRTFDYPPASLAALEATLVRLTLESPLGPSGGG